jgi:hypothetical protein
MELLLTQYLTIYSTLVADKTEGISTAANTMQELAKALDPGQAGAHDERYLTIARDIAPACSKLKAADDITTARDAFKLLSKPIAMWVEIAKPKEMAVMYCPMAESVWVQRGSEVANPYYGAKMLSCGQKVGGAD